MNHYKYYQEGDTDPVSRKLGVVLSYSSESGLRFVGQRRMLDREYIEKMRTSFIQGIGVIHILNDRFMTERVLDSRAALRELFHE